MINLIYKKSILIDSYPLNSIVSFSLGDKIESAKVIKDNFYTVLVRFKDKVIKRHKAKHNVTINRA